MRRLYGRMPTPSEADSGVALWISSLGASPAPDIPTPANAAESMTSATCGARPAGSSRSQARGDSSSKTSLGCSPVATQPCPLAPTGYGETYTGWALRLREAFSLRKKLVRRRNVNGCSSSLWPTVASRDYRTPNSQDSQDSQDRRNAGSPRGQQLVNYVEHLWQTPSVSDATGSRLARGGKRSAEPLMGGQARDLSSRLAQRTPKPGSTFSASDRRLNPAFVEMIQGWAPGLTASECSGTAACRYRRRMRSALLRLTFHDAPLAQRDLFG